MQVSVKTQPPTQVAVDLLTVPLYKIDPKKKVLPRRIASLDRSLGGCISAAVSRGDFKGGVGESQLVYPDTSTRHETKRVLLVGLGEESACDADALRALAGRCVQRGAATRSSKVAVIAPSWKRGTQVEACQALTEGAFLGAYRFDTYKSKPKKPSKPVASMTLLFEKLSNASEARRASKRGKILAESQNVARNLSNEPANHMPPVELARNATRIAKEAGLRVQVMDVAELKRRKMGGIISVGQGSAHPPRLIILDHNPRSAAGSKRKGAAHKSKRPTICFIGKGITFDSGGISIKPSANMHEMKHDMSGAAAVIGAMRAVGLLKVPQRVVGIVAAAENMPSSTAYRPGDIITTYSGKTVEVLNTDAEGRIVLADALAYAAKTYDPIAMIDLATLTGACMVALGGWATGLMGNDDALVEAIQQAGERSGECAWPMPLFDGHKKAMRGSISDLVNVAGREASLSTAAGFLSAFVGETPWVHLDIAGTGWTNKTSPFQARGATGVGVRMLLEYLSKSKA